jgi:hypothetical protein
MKTNKLPPAMDKAMRNAEVDVDGELNVCMAKDFGRSNYVRIGTQNALQRRGLINARGQFTENGKDWFNANVDA